MAYTIWVAPNGPASGSQGVGFACHACTNCKARTAVS